MQNRTLLLLASLATLALVVAGTVRAASGPHVVRRPEAARSTAADTTTRHALGVLRRWDHRRAAAWRHADPVALRALYRPGSRAGRRDVAMLAAYRSRGLTVRQMGRQVLAVHVRRSTQRRLSLVVTDRLVEARVVGDGLRAALPDSRPVTREIDLRRGPRWWRVGEVYER